MTHPQFGLKQAKNGDFYFNLTAKNGQVIATSEMYKSKAACENGIESVKENAPIADVEDYHEQEGDLLERTSKRKRKRSKRKLQSKK